MVATLSQRCMYTVCLEVSLKEIIGCQRGKKKKSYSVVHLWLQKKQRANHQKCAAGLEPSSGNKCHVMFWFFET